jgi:hypothetical protein
MNIPLLGKELNKKHRVNDNILTPEEIVEVGLTYVPAFPYVTEDGETIEGTCRKLKYRFDHNWDDETKLNAKEAIVRELKYSNCLFIRKLYLTPFADDMDYSHCSYNIGVLVSCGKRSADVELYNESINPHEVNTKVIEQLCDAKKNIPRVCPHKSSNVCYRDDYAVGDLVVWKEFCRGCGKLLATGMNQYVQSVPDREVIISPTTKYNEGYYINRDFI